MTTASKKQLPQQVMQSQLQICSPWVSLIFFVVSLILPFVVPYTDLASETAIFSLFAISFNILLGFTGLLSFGHAMFFGIGAYGAGLAMANWQMGPLMVIGVGLLFALLAAVIVGFLCLKSYGISLTFLTLAFAEVVYFIAYQASNLTGGEDGLGLPRKSLQLPGITIDLKNPIVRYYFILAIVVVCFFLVHRILNSPFGRVLVSIRENEERTSFLGFNTRLYKLISFCLSGLFTGIAGALYALHLAFVPIESLHWSTSGEIVIITLLGGMGNFFGPVIGVAIFIGLRELISPFLDRWQLVVGMIFVLVVIFLPEGLASIPQKVKVKGQSGINRDPADTQHRP
ncbi:MAG: branched-chain amino acid ABC transporter permease [Deltaproteobacteria bacterium]|nr:MAG: branched-chain amino acid ABC transporter permease [Deltaproteobacteria bacterium]